jgi:hypothetical protein
LALHTAAQSEPAQQTSDAMTRDKSSAPRKKKTSTRSLNASPELAQIQERIDQPTPLTWLFTGTNYRFNAT